MEDQKKYKIIGIVLVFCVLMAILFYPKHPANEENRVIDEKVPEQKENELEEVQVKGYHLVTYAQSANTNSFLQTLTITATSDAQIHLVIGTIDEQSIVQQRTSFEMECKQGENTFDLRKERHLIKQGEYLFMDINGQDILYQQKGTEAKSLVQNENNKVSGKMKMSQSHYSLPFKYTLETVENYHALVIGNEITTKDNGKGLNATNESLDYYSLTKTRLENTFATVKMSRMNATQWEKSQTRKEWLMNDLKNVSLTDLDLVIFQLGDNYTEGNLEKDVTDFVEHIRQYSPNAEMIWIGLWKMNENILNALPGICEKLGIEFINISDLAIPEYQSQVTENLDDGTVQEAYYPNNEAMQMISNRILEVLKYMD